MKGSRLASQRTVSVLFAAFAAVCLPQALGFSTTLIGSRVIKRCELSGGHSRHVREVCAAFMTSSINGGYDDDFSTPETAATAIFMSATSNNDDNQKDVSTSLRCRLRKATGFSLTAFRATMRAATGISLTAVYASALAATSQAVRKTMTFLLSPLPPWFRYFLQPLLILYYAPLFILRNLAGPTARRARETHEVFVDGFKSAVDAAERKADGYWPVHVNEEGEIVSVDPPRQSSAKQRIDLTEGVAESVEVVMDENNSQ